MKSTEPFDFIHKLPSARSVSKLSKSSIYKGVKEGTFPAPVKISARSVGWKNSDLMCWLESRAPASTKGGAE
jgi:prophage regulatory protein